jgi:hypothetical protein
MHLDQMDENPKFDDLFSIALGYASGTAKPNENGNHRNGTSAKTVLTDEGALRIDIPRKTSVAKPPLDLPRLFIVLTEFDCNFVLLRAL